MFRDFPEHGDLYGYGRLPLPNFGRAHSHHLANVRVFTFRHVSALKSAMAEAWCCELLISRFGTFNHLRPRECSDALSVLQPFSSNPGISPYCLPPDTSGTVDLRLRAYPKSSRVCAPLGIRTFSNIANSASASTEDHDQVTYSYRAMLHSANAAAEPKRLRPSPRDVEPDQPVLRFPDCGDDQRSVIEAHQQPGYVIDDFQHRRQRGLCGCSELHLRRQPGLREVMRHQRYVHSQCDRRALRCAHHHR